MSLIAMEALRSWSFYLLNDLISLDGITSWFAATKPSPKVHPILFVDAAHIHDQRYGSLVHIKFSIAP